MNIEKIDEPIGVLASFTGGACQPLRFRWGVREYRVDAVNGRWIDRGGEGYRLHFSVQVGSETFYLHFCSSDVQWVLDKVIVT